MKISIWINVYDFNRSYSLMSVVFSQMYMLEKNGIDYQVMVLENFNDKKVPEKFKKRFKPVIPIFDWSKPNTINEDMVLKLQKMFIEYGTEINFEHDLIFQESFTTFAKAIHVACDSRDDWVWYHWTHSAPSPQNRSLEGAKKFRYTMPKNSKMVSLNYYDMIMLSEMYGVMPSDVVVIKNSNDPRISGVTEETQFILDQTSLMNYDIIQIYPISLPRHEGKQIDKLIRVLNGIAEVSKKRVLLLIVDAHSNFYDSDSIKEKYTDMARGIKIQFTSDLSHKFIMGIPHKSVIELFGFSDLFIFPSLSEAGPLILMEAAQAGNLIVLNEDFPPILEYYNEALKFRFSSTRFKTSYSDENKWFKDVGRIIYSVLERSPQYRIKSHFRKEFNLDSIFNNYYLPELSRYESVD